MKVPSDCIHCRHQGRTDVCNLFVNPDKTCSIIHSGDEWHVKNHERMTKEKQRESDERFDIKFRLNKSAK